MAVRNLSDITALEKVPLEERHLPSSTYAGLKAQAEKTPQSPALTFFLDAAQLENCGHWTYEQLLADITRTANVFTDLGLKPDEVVAFILPNLPETHFTIWGGEAAGIVMPINPLLDAEQIGQLLRVARARIVVSLAPTSGTDLWQKLASQLDTLPDITAIVLVSIARYVPAASRAPFNPASGLSGLKQLRSAKLRVVELASAMSARPADKLISGRIIQPHEISSYFCTGGTTGLPKIACRTHGSEVFDAWAVGLMMEPRTEPSVYFCGLPLFHVNGQLVTGLMPWTHGDHVVLGTPQGYREPEVIKQFWRIVEHFRVNFFSGVPTVYASLLQQPVASNDISSLEYALCGAAAMPAELFRNFETKTGVRILEGYGLTEGACVSSINPPAGERRIGSIGFRLPYQAMRAVILDSDGQYSRDARAGEIGTIVVHGPNLFAGYLHENGRSVWLKIGGQQWLNTGDVGRQDAEGYFWLVGRSKEIIIRGGHNIDPQVIEEPLLHHPEVQMAAAVPRPDPHLGELPVAYVQLKAGSKVSEESLLEYTKNSIGERAAWPKAIRVIDQMPQTAVGKLSKLVLRQREIRDALLQALTKAGLDDSRVEMVEDPQTGLRVHVIVHTDDSKKTAEEVLAHYSVAFTVSVGNRSLR